MAMSLISMEISGKKLFLKGFAYTGKLDLNNVDKLPHVLFFYFCLLSSKDQAQLMTESRQVLFIGSQGEVTCHGTDTSAIRVPCRSTTKTESLALFVCWNWCS